MSKIALIYMGGTFGCVGEPLSPMPEHEFLPRLHGYLPDHLSIECFAAPVIKDSSAYTAVDWLKLAQFIQQLQSQSFQHFVVIHGTDTLSYASAVLARILAKSCHLIITGSQFPLLTVDGTTIREETDARDNLWFALEHIFKVDAGVYLAFHHQLFHGRTALKAHTTELDAFKGIASTQAIPQHSQAMTVTETMLERAQNLNILNWMMQPISLNQLEQNLAHVLNHAPDFLILQGFGTGNLVTNPAIIEIFQQLKQKNCLPVLNTQVTAGGIDQRYAVSAWVKEANIAVSDCLGHADLYAKLLALYLHYDQANDWLKHWHE